MSQDPSDDDLWTGTDDGRTKTRDGPLVVNAVRDNVEVAFFDPSRLSDAIGDIASLDSRTVTQRIRQVRSRELFEPDGRFTEHNVIVKPYRELLAKLINPEESTPNRQATHIAFGDDDTATDPSDTHLINEVYRQQIDDHVTRTADDQYAATVLIQSNDAVSESLLEAGLVNTSDPTNADDEAFNRVLLSDPNNRLDPKTSDFAVTVTIELTFLDESQVA